jgi:hypothetical protein
MPDVTHAYPGWGRALTAAAILVLMPTVIGALWSTASTNAAAASSSPTLAGCPMLPADNVWNAPVDSLPIHVRSSDYVGSIGSTAGLKADFGSGTWDGGPIGIPYVVVDSRQSKVPVGFDYVDESDPGPYPIPPNAPIEGGPNSSGDRHILVVERDSCTLYETWSTYPNGSGWQAGSGAVFDLNSNALRPDGWTSADAAGLPILPGLARYDEVAAGQINHALRVTAPVTQRAYIWPARHYASSWTDQNLPPMGLRLRLRSSFDISQFSRDNQVILQALKTYGLILADNGSSWFVSGVPDERWNNEDLQRLRSIPGSAFEAVDTTPLMLDPSSGQVKDGPPSNPTATPTSSSATATPTRPAATATPTKQPSPTATPTTQPSPIATPTQASTERKLTLQGSSLLDTWISPDDPNAIFVTLDAAHLQGSFTPDRLLFKPLLQGLTKRNTVVSATLSIYAYSATTSGDLLSIYPILRSWDPSSTTYRRPWKSPGLRAGSDYAAQPVATFQTTGGGWILFDVTGVVQGWVSKGSVNGFVVMQSAGASNAHYKVYLSEANDPSVRPSLSITYR